MGKRRYAQVATSDDEEEEEDEDEKSPPPPQRPATRSSAGPSNSKKQPAEDEDSDEEMKEAEEEEEEDEEEEGEKEEEEESEDENDDDDSSSEYPKPLGEVVRVSGKGRNRKQHYVAFELDGNKFELEDPVLLSHGKKNIKPYVAIIKDITQAEDGDMRITGQWFYRPEEAEKKGGGSWQAIDTRELFYSFHRDEDIHAESVMHKCIVHFVPLNKQLPVRKKNPGFIVQRVYDTVEKKLWKLSDKDYEDSKQHEIDLLVAKTVERLGDLLDLYPEEGSLNQQDDIPKAKVHLRPRNLPPINVSKDEETTRPDHFGKLETPGSCLNEASEFYIILSNFKALTGDSCRDKWLEKLLQAIQSAFDSNKPNHEAGNGSSLPTDSTSPMKDSETSNNPQQGQGSARWPDDAVSAVCALEEASHEAFSSDLQKYKVKMRQLFNNLKNNLARRLLDKELEPSVILTMSPRELGDGITTQEKSIDEPQEPRKPFQMTDVRCKICLEKKVHVADIIHVGYGDRYQLECLQCGHEWYASRDAINMLTEETPNTAVSVGTAPLATAKFEDANKMLTSPQESAPDIFQKTKPYMPVLESQKSMNDK